MSATGRAPRIGLGFVIVATLFTLFVGFAHKSLCLTGEGFNAEFSWLGRYFNDKGLPVWPLEVAVVARAVVLGAILVTLVRRPIRARPTPAEAAGVVPA